MVRRELSRYGLCALSIAALLAVDSAQLRAQDRDSTLAAILRADGIALPFARFDGRSWSAFPAARGDTAPRPPEQYEVPRVWRFYPADGSPARRLRGGTTVVFNTDSETQYEEWGQLTDHSPRTAPRDDSYPQARVGFLLSSAVAASATDVVTFREHSSRSSAWQTTRPAVARAFAEAEASLFRGRAPSGLAPWPAQRQAPDSATRASRPIELDRFYGTRDPVGGARLLYVEAHKVYAGPGDKAHCPAAVRYSAWFRQLSNTAAPVLVAGNATLDYACDHTGRWTLAPFGAFRLSGRVFVVAERMLWEGAERQVLEVAAAAVRPAF